MSSLRFGCRLMQDDLNQIVPNQSHLYDACNIVSPTAWASLNNYIRWSQQSFFFSACVLAVYIQLWLPKIQTWRPRASQITFPLTPVNCGSLHCTLSWWLSDKNGQNHHGRSALYLSTITLAGGRESDSVWSHALTSAFLGHGVKESGDNKVSLLYRLVCIIILSFLLLLVITSRCRWFMFWLNSITSIIKILTFSASSAPTTKVYPSSILTIMLHTSQTASFPCAFSFLICTSFFWQDWLCSILWVVADERAGHNRVR